MSFETVQRGGQVVNLADYGVITYEGRRRSYATQQGRMVEGRRWGVFGDRLELPSKQAIRLYVRDQHEDGTPTTRAWQRNAIEELGSLLPETTVLRIIPDLREYLVHGGEIEAEVVTGETYALDITFPMREPDGRFLDGFPLGALRVTQYYANGTAIVEPLERVTTYPDTFTLTDDTGQTYTFTTLGVTYG